MPGQFWNQLLVSQEAAGASYASFTTAKTIINQSNLYSFPANYFKIGTKLRVTAHYGISNIATTPGTITFQVMLGAIVVWTSGAIQLNATAHTTKPAKLIVDLTCQLANTTVGGVIAKFMGAGVLTGVMFTLTAGQTDAANTPGAFPVPSTLPALGTAFDGTIAQTLDHWVGFSISDPANLVQIAQYDVEELGATK